MKRSLRNWGLLAVLTVLLLLLLILFQIKKADDGSTNSQIANPASAYCVEKNGTLEIRTTANGQYGVCIKNDKECEEWEFFRGECTL